MLVSVAVLSSLAAHAQNELDEKIDSNIADGIGTYRHIHEHPKLPLKKKKRRRWLPKGCGSWATTLPTILEIRRGGPHFVWSGRGDEERAGSDGVCAHGTGRAAHQSSIRSDDNAGSQRYRGSSDRWRRALPREWGMEPGAQLALQARSGQQESAVAPFPGRNQLL